MKKLIFFILLCLAAYYQFFYSAKTTSNSVTAASDQAKNEPSLSERIKEWWNKNETGSKTESGKEDLKKLKEELAAKESLLAQVEKRIAELMANPPSCPRGPATLVITNDPRDGLRKDISILREKIANLEK
jgi:seryl-tRNA synthetase